MSLPSKVDMSLILLGFTHTLEEIGHEWHVTREHIRQIEAKALHKLRHPTQGQQLQDYLE